MLNDPFRYLRRKWTMQSTDDDLHCIRYTACSCLHSGSHLLCRSHASSTIALERTDALISCMHETGYPHGLYKTDRGHRSCLSKENSFSFVHGIPFSFTLRKQVCTGFVVALRLAIPIDRNGEAQGQA